MKPNTVELAGHGMQRELPALNTITPGMLLTRSISPEGVTPHDGDILNPYFAVEYDLTGRGIDDDYAQGNQVIWKSFAPGSQVNALVTGEVSAAALLYSAGDGTLTDTPSGRPIAQALESGTGRLKVEVLA